MLTMPFLPLPGSPLDVGVVYCWFISTAGVFTAGQSWEVTGNMTFFAQN
jgi:hypothetical protein